MSTINARTQATVGSYDANLNKWQVRTVTYVRTCTYSNYTYVGLVFLYACSVAQTVVGTYMYTAIAEQILRYIGSYHAVRAASSDVENSGQEDIHLYYR
eukprot:COSAG05_NODE_8051_length_741_cov_1.342679_1_plen_99_part_00